MINLIENVIVTSTSNMYQMASVGSVLGWCLFGAAALAAIGYYKKIQDVKQGNSTENPSKPTATFKENINMAAAQKAFLTNLHKFVPLLNDSKIDSNKWSDAVIDINDDDLMALWYKMVNRPDLWVNQMASWGLKQERCEAFTAMDKHIQLYATANGTEITLGQKYIVKSPCWLLTSQDENGRVIKKVVKKGIVEPA